MNTATNINQINPVITRTVRDGSGLLRHGMAAILLAIGIAAAAVGLAATSHADDGLPAPNIEATVAPPAPLIPWLPFADPGCRRQLFYFNGRVHCG